MNEREVTLGRPWKRPYAVDCATRSSRSSSRIAKLQETEKSLKELLLGAGDKERSLYHMQPMPSVLDRLEKIEREIHAIKVSLSIR